MVREEHNNEKALLISLFEKAQNGDEGSFEELYKSYYTPLFKYVYLRTKDKLLSEDITQTVFLKVWKSLNLWNSKKKEPRAFLYTIARNTIIDYWRKKSTKEIVSDEIVFNNQESVLMENKEDEETYKTLLNLFNKLTKLEKEILTLLYINELSYEEIAKVTGKKESAIRQIKSRAIKSLKEEYNKQNG